MRDVRVRSMVTTALLMALVVLLGLTPVGLIPLGFVYVTVLCVPVIIGTLVNGLLSGVILGAGFGLVSLYTAITKPSALVAPILSASLPAAMAMCLLPRLLIPLVVYGINRLLNRTRCAPALVSGVAAVAGSLTNTVFFLGFMLLFYQLLWLPSEGVLTMITGIGVIAGGSEAAVAAILAIPIVAAVRRAFGEPARGRKSIS
ncbi:MAG: ECF transporter S component [Clostridia bacterium]|nr:ECF transporter S component [Clostridia bacterium]